MSDRNPPGPGPCSDPATTGFQKLPSACSYFPGGASGLTQHPREEATNPGEGPTPQTTPSHPSSVADSQRPAWEVHRIDLFSITWQFSFKFPLKKKKKGKRRPGRQEAGARESFAFCE